MVRLNLMSLVPYDHHNGDVYDIDLAAPPDERWLDAASQMGDRVHALLTHLCQSIDDHIAEEHGNSLSSRLLVATAPKLIGKALRSIGGDYVTEILSIARVIGVDPDLLITANLSYELEGLCSSISFEDRKGRPILARTLDWAVPESAGEHSVRLRFHRGRQAYDSISVAGFVGLLSVQRPGRWAMTLNMAPTTGGLGRLLQLSQMPVAMHLRACADVSLSYPSLITNITEMQTAAPFFVHVIGVKAGERTILTGHGASYSRRTTDGNGTLAITNHHVNNQGLPEDESADDNSVVRFAALCRRHHRINPTSVKDAHRLIARGPITYEQTQQAMVLCPALDHIDLLIRPNPAWSTSDAPSEGAWESAELDCPICHEAHDFNDGPGDYVCPTTGRLLTVT